MSVAMADLIQYVLGQVLNEVANSNVAASYSDSGGTIATTQADGVTRAFNDAKNLACRSYFPVEGQFTSTYAQNVYAKEYAAFAPVTGDGVFPTPANSVPWWAYRGFWTISGATTPLQYASSQIVFLYNPNYQNTLDATKQGAPASGGYFYRMGTEAVGVSPVPNASGLVTVQAWCVPPDALATDTITWIPGDEWEVLAVHAAKLILEKASNDAQLAARKPDVDARWARLAMLKYMTIPANLRDGSRGATVPFPMPPVAVGGK